MTVNEMDFKRKKKIKAFQYLFFQEYKNRENKMVEI
jgi:hypothetical protein